MKAINQVTIFPASVILILGLGLWGVHTGLTQWIQQNSSTSVNLNDIIMLDSLTAIAVGNSGIILKTTDAGQNWDSKFSRTGVKWNAVAFADLVEGIVVGDNLTMAVTTDGGETWTFTDSSSTHDFLSVAYMGGTTVYIGDDSGRVIYSSDGGSIWNEIYFNNYPINAIFFTQSAYLYYYGHIVTPGIDYETSDSGNTWVAISLPISIWGSYANSGNISPAGEIAFIVGSYSPHLGLLPWILRKTANDSEWVTYTFPLPPVPAGELYDVAVPSPQVAYACGTEGTIFKTTNGGSLWDLNLYGHHANLNAIDFYDENIGLSVGDSGTIIYTSNGGVTNIETDKKSYLADYILYQNYPNPFNSTTTIRYEIPHTSNVQLNIYNILGEKVRTLVNGKQEEGFYDIVFNARELGSGVYFYTLQTDNIKVVRSAFLIK